MKTEQEIEDLKRQWCDDPIWDIEKSEGFEDHREPLLAFRLEKEAQWQAQHDAEVQRKAIAIGCPDNLPLAKYVMFLERRIRSLEEAIQP